MNCESSWCLTPREFTIDVMTIPRRTSSQLFPQILRSRHWLAADRPLADVGGRLAVHHRTIGEQVRGSRGRGRRRDCHDQVGSQHPADLGDQPHRSLVSRVADDGDLHLLCQSEITRTKPASEAGRIVDGQIGHKAERPLGQRAPLCGASESSKGQQGLCGERIPRRDSVVLQVLWAYKELLRPAGGFFDTPDGAEQLLIRPKDLQDNAVPSGNALAAEALLTLATLTGTTEWRTLAERSLGLVTDLAVHYPTSFGCWLCAGDFGLAKEMQVAIVGDPADERTMGLIAEVRGVLRPNLVMAVSPAPPPAGAPDLLALSLIHISEPTAYVCEGSVCRQPVTRPEDLREQLR